MATFYHHCHFLSCQMNATFILQGIHMKLPSFSHFRNFPAAWLLLFNAITIVVLLPIMEKFVYPWLSKRGYRIIPLTRISIGKFEVGNVPHWSGEGIAVGRHIIAHCFLEPNWMYFCEQCCNIDDQVAFDKLPFAIYPH